MYPEYLVASFAMAARVANDASTIDHGFQGRHIDILYARAIDALITNLMKLIGLMGLWPVEWWMCTKATEGGHLADIFVCLCVYLCACLLCICVCLCLIGLLGGGGGRSLSGSLADDERWQVLSLFGG